MPREITISVPDEVADRLERETNVSEYVSMAIQHQMAQEPKRRAAQKAMQEYVDNLKSRFSAEEIAGVDRKIEEARAKMTPELRAWARRLLAEQAPHRLRQLPQA